MSDPITTLYKALVKRDVPFDFAVEFADDAALAAAWATEGVESTPRILVLAYLRRLKGLRDAARVVDVIDGVHRARAQDWYRRAGDVARRILVLSPQTRFVRIRMTAADLGVALPYRSRDGVESGLRALPPPTWREIRAYLARAS